MKFLNYSFATITENIAFDETLLNWCEKSNETELLRFWESPETGVVLGRSKKVNEETFKENCQQDSIIIQRRCSGGGTVLQGPGCLNYAFILDIKNRPECSNITNTTQFILENVIDALSTFIQNPIIIKGSSDLTVNNIKFSGNAQRRKRFYALFHGTILYDFKLKNIDKYLKVPPVIPEYRKNRPHLSFIQNVSINPSKIKESFKKQWQCTDFMDSDKLNMLISDNESLVKKQYLKTNWV